MRGMWQLVVLILGLLMLTAALLPAAVASSSPKSVADRDTRTLGADDGICGDINNDGILYTVADYVLLFRYIIGQSTLPIPENADLDQCGGIDVADLARYIHYFNFGLPPAICDPAAECTLPTGTNRIYMPCGTVAYPYPASIDIPIYVTNEDPLMALSLGLRCSSNQVHLSTVITSGTILPDNYSAGLYSVLDTSYVWPVTDSSEVVLLVAQNLAEGTQLLEPHVNGLVAKIRVTIDADADPGEIDIEPVFVEPAGGMLLAPVSGGVIVPTFADCGTANITLGPDVCGDDPYTDCTPGDYNGDGVVNISDAIWQLNWTFAGGPAPRPWSVCSGDANGDCTAGVTDAIVIIQWIFVGGGEPVNCATWQASCTNPGAYNPGPWK